MEENENEGTNHDTCPFVAYLLNLFPERDRGVLADLRKGFSKATAIRAWPHIGHFCHLNDDKARTICETIGAGYATHPENDNTPYANFGSVMKKLAFESIGNDTEKRQSFDTMFRRLIACESVEELCKRIRNPIQAAKSKNIPIPWEALYFDLKYWNNGVKVRWAAKYWGGDDEISETETDDINNGESETDLSDLTEEDES